MARDARVQELAEMACGLAAGAGIELPASLQLWALAGGRPRGVPAMSSADPAGTLGHALEAMLTADERRMGAHYTPASLADELSGLALPAIDEPRTTTVVDPACGGGALLLAAGRRLVAAGAPLDEVARDLLWGADLDPAAAAVTEAAITLWSGGTPPTPGHVAAGDALVVGRALWPTASNRGFGAVVANPPFQGQLARSTARGVPERDALRRRFGEVVTAYVDTAALFLLLGVELAAGGARVVMVQPQSTVASRDAGPVRDALAERATLVDLVVPSARHFAASVDVCLPVLEVRLRVDATERATSDWAGRMAAGRGVPAVALRQVPSLATMAGAVAGFRQHYYGLVPHVREAPPEATELDLRPLVTSGSIGVGTSTWGTVPTRFARSGWDRPVVDGPGVARADPSLGQWLELLDRPKVLVASQTRVLEAVADATGRWVPSVPVVAVLPHDAEDVHRVTAALCAPPVSAWAAVQASGTGMSSTSMRVSTALVLAAPLPVDRHAWNEAAELLRKGDVDGFAEVGAAMYGLSGASAAEVLGWWQAQLGRDD